MAYSCNALWTRPLLQLYADTRCLDGAHKQPKFVQ